MIDRKYVLLLPRYAVTIPLENLWSNVLKSVHWWIKPLSLMVVKNPDLNSTGIASSISGKISRSLRTEEDNLSVDRHRIVYPPLCCKQYCSLHVRTLEYPATKTHLYRCKSIVRSNSTARERWMHCAILMDRRRASISAIVECKVTEYVPFLSAY